MGDELKNTFFKVAVACSMLVSVLGCGKVAGPMDPAPAVTTYQGEWDGTTSEGLAISFTVSGNTIIRFEINMMTGVPAASQPFNLKETQNISDNYIHINVTRGAGGTEGVLFPSIPVNGPFTSLIAAEGTAGAAPGIITWKAEKK
jgi:predicted alpha/beta-hydrolase family hydrolase